MRTSTHRRLSVATTEHLLDGAPGTTPLHRLLAAATRPGSPEELSGAAAAHAAFVAANRNRPLPADPPGEPLSKLLLSKLIAAKAVVALALLGGATGVAVATTSGSTDSTGTLPATASERATPHGQQAGAPDDTDPAGAEDPDSALAGTGDDTETSDATAGGSGSTHPSPSPSLRGLCTAWAAGAGDNPGKAAENPAFGALVKAAGDPGAVPGYCEGLEKESEKAADSTDSTDSATTAEDESAGTTETAAPGASAESPGHTGERGASTDAKEKAKN